MSAFHYFNLNTGLTTYHVDKTIRENGRGASAVCEIMEKYLSEAKNEGWTGVGEGRKKESTQFGRCCKRI